MMDSMPPPPPPPPPPSNSGPHSYLHLTSNAAETSSPSSSSLSAPQRADRYDQLSGSASPSQPQPPPQPQQQQQQHHPAQPHSHLMHGGPHSPKSSQSSPYVSPRPQHRDTLDASSMSMPPHAPILRRGAVSGASGPLSFPPLPTPFRSNSDGPSDDGSRSRPAHYTQGSDYDVNMGGGGPQHDPHHHQQQQLQAHHHPHHLDAHHYQQHPHGHQQQHEEHPGAGSMMPVYQAKDAGNHQHQHHGHFSGGQTAPRMPSFSAGNSGMGPSGVSILTPGSSASPSFPLPSSYSLSSGGSAGPGGVPSAATPSSYGAQRRGGLSASSGVGVYGAAAQAGATPTGHHPYWSAHNQPPQMHMGPHSTGAGFKRKQTSANPPPRNYACPSCPASFSRRHDLNRHSRIHLAVKPYGCPNCQKSFSRKDALKRHLMVKGCGKDAEGRPKKRRGRKSAAERLAAAAAAAEAAGEDGKPSGLTVGSDGGAHGAEWASGHGSDRITPMDEGDSDEEDDEDEEDDYEDQGPAMGGHGMGFDGDDVQGYPGRGAAQGREGSGDDMQTFYSRSYDQDQYTQGGRNGEEHGDPYQHQQAWA